MDKREYYLSVLKRIDGMLSFAETKITFMLAYLAVLLASLINQAGEVKDILQGPVSALLIITTASLALFLFTLIYVLFCIGRVLLPHTKFSGRDSHVYFFDISRGSESAYIASMRDMKENEIEEDLLSQIHAISSVTTAKFNNIRIATYLLGLLTILWLVLTVEAVIFSS